VIAPPTQYNKQFPFLRQKTFTICGATGITLSTSLPTKMTIMIAPGFEMGGEAGITFTFFHVCSIAGNHV